MSLEDPKEAVKIALLDRLTHPVMGVLMIALAVSNWKPVIFLIVSTAPASQRIEQAGEYFTVASLVGWPIFWTVVWVILGPILKVLALTYDRYISNWEKMRAYRAALNVLEQNTEDAKRALSEVEQALAKKREELSGAADQVQRKQAELKAASDELDTVLRVGNAGWQSGFVGGGSFPYSPGSEAYRRAEAKFQAVEKLKATVLGRS